MHESAVRCTADLFNPREQRSRNPETVMKRSLLALATVGLLSAGAASYAAEPPLGLLGNQASSEQAVRTITITPKTKYVNVTKGEVVRFVAGDKAFAWNFDGVEEDFPLNRVAPSGVLTRKVTVYVAPNGEDNH
jgi:Heavy-metal resistance protein CzcE